MHKTLKITYLQTYNADCTEILHSDKDHQLRFVGSAKSKMADGRHLKKSKNGHVSTTVLPISTKFDMVTHP